MTSFDLSHTQPSEEFLLLLFPQLTLRLDGLEMDSKTQHIFFRLSVASMLLWTLVLGTISSQPQNSKLTTIHQFPERHWIENLVREHQ
jgi:hypothetical protein